MTCVFQIRIHPTRVFVGGLARGVSINFIPFSNLYSLHFVKSCQFGTIYSNIMRIETL